jgi:cell division protein FtsI (penicillin-binding protein 3)
MKFTSSSHQRSQHSSGKKSAGAASIRDIPEDSSVAPVQHSDTEQTTKRFDSNKIKLLSIFLGLGLGFCAVLAKLFTIQLYDGQSYRDMARKQYEAKILLAAERGAMYDRYNRIIATTLPRLSVAVDPNMIESPRAIGRLLSAITGKPVETYLKKINEASSSFVWLERGIASESLTALDTLQDAGLIRLREPRRYFGFGSLAAQTLGFTDIDNRGVSGLEMSFDSLLRGTNGMTILLRDGRGNKRPISDEPLQAPRNGLSLALTLDMHIQGIVEHELKKGVESANAESGTAIALDPRTGEILAMSSYPTFNPNDIRTAQPEYIRNRAITDMYEPGSTFKIVTAAALIEEKLLSPESLVDAHDGVWQCADRTIRDDHPQHGSVTFAQALEQSSNIVAAEQSQLLRNDKFYKYVRDFGFGIVSGIDIPGEIRGIVRKPKEFDRITKQFMAFGYSLGATPLQLVNAYSTIANNGIMMKPFVVREVRNESGGVVKSFQAQKIRRVVSQETAQKVNAMLVGVVNNGTGKQARIDGLSIAGKTGTAQQLTDGRYSKQDYTASFAGFFPAEQPQVALVVMLTKPRNGYYGGEVAAPIFRRIAQQIASAGVLTLPRQAAQRIRSEVQKEVMSSDGLQSSSTVTLMMPDIRGMQWADAEITLANKGLRFSAESTPRPDAIVLAQSIVPHQSVAPGTETLVRFCTTISPQTLPDALPQLEGLSVRRAMAILHGSALRGHIIGSGTRITRATWNAEQKLCMLETQ